MLHQAQGLLILKLIDVVAGQAGLNENEDYARLREDVGRYIVEGRSPTKTELDSIAAKADELGNCAETNFRASFEDPAQHVSPAYLKGDVLRSGSGKGSSRGSVLFDPWALENQRGTAEALAEAGVGDGPQPLPSLGNFDPEQVALRARQELRESTVAKEGATGAMIGKKARPQNAIEAERLALGEDASTNEAPAGEGAVEVDWAGTSDDDLRSYLKEQKVKFKDDATRDDLISASQEAYNKANAKK